MSQTGKSPATVFVDRDGVINEKLPEGHYVTGLQDLRLLPGSIDALARLSKSGRLVIVVTNQQGVAKGLVTEEALEEIHSALTDAVDSHGGQIDSILVCPHLKDTCDCRKPKTGLFEQARERFPKISFQDSVMVGDSITDMEAAHAIGARAVRITENPHASRAPGTPIEVSTLSKAADLILEAANV